MARFILPDDYIDLSGQRLKYEKMVDEHSIVHIKEKTVDIENAEIGKIVCGDTNSQMITFQMNRFYDNVDLKDKKIIILYKNKALSGYDEATNIRYTDEAFGGDFDVYNQLRFSWVMSYNATSYKGTLTAAIQFYGEDEYGNSYSLKTANFAVKVEPSLDGTSLDTVRPDNWFVNIENRLRKLEESDNEQKEEISSVVQESKDYTKELIEETSNSSVVEF